LDDPSTVNAAIAGAFGTLTLHADGSYIYARDPGAPGNVTDTFTYTIKDGDGDLASATLMVALATNNLPGNIVIPAPGGATTTVFEAGLLAARGPGESAGSHAGETAFPTATQAGAITFTSLDGVSKVELGGHVLSGSAQTFADGTTGSLTASFAFN